MKFPKYVEIENKRYKINTDFRVAIECNRIAEDETIGDIERVLGIIYTLFGEEGINTPEHYEKLLEMAKKYLCCGQELEQTNEKPYMDFIEDEGDIRSSFQYDYKYDPYEEEYVHWYKYYNDLKNLSNSEFGDCCVLNRIINLRKFDVSKIKDRKEKEKIIKAQKPKVLLTLVLQPTYSSTFPNDIVNLIILFY